VGARAAAARPHAGLCAVAEELEDVGVRLLDAAGGPRRQQWLPAAGLSLPEVLVRCLASQAAEVDPLEHVVDRERRLLTERCDDVGHRLARAGDEVFVAQAEVRGRPPLRGDGEQGGGPRAGRVAQEGARGRAGVEDRPLVAAAAAEPARGLRLVPCEVEDREEDVERVPGVDDRAEAEGW
jgi:hypothetical protein